MTYDLPTRACVLKETTSLRNSCHQQSKIRASQHRREKLSASPGCSRFCKDAQYMFFLLWQKKMLGVSAGEYNVLLGGSLHLLACY